MKGALFRRANKYKKSARGPAEKATSIFCEPGIAILQAERLTLGVVSRQESQTGAKYCHVLSPIFLFWLKFLLLIWLVFVCIF